MAPGYDLSQFQAHAILLQRTGYQPAWTAYARKLGLGMIYDRVLAARLSPAQRRRIGELYRAEMQAEAEAIAPLLPEGARTLLDIGCGLAGPDLELARKLPDLQLVLLDRDEFNTVPHYGYTSEAAAYNSLDATREFLTTNGVDESRIETVDILRETFPANREFDAVISVISWGFHYPVETYVSQVQGSLRAGGVCIIDVRSDSDALHQLEAAFGTENVTSVHTPHTDIERLMAVKRDDTHI